MKKIWLKGELLLISIYILVMLVLAAIDGESRFLALTMFILLGAWQFWGALIWIVLGDKIRRPYILAASLYLLSSWLMIVSPWFKQLELLVIGLFVSVPISLAIWYQYLTYRHIVQIDQDEIAADEAPKQDLL